MLVTAEPCKTQKGLYIMRNRRVFYITEGTIRDLARELARAGVISKDDITTELVEEVRVAVLTEFRDWDTWIKELILNIVIYEPAARRVGK